MARILIHWDNWEGFEWRVMDGDQIMKSGREKTEAKAVVSGQDALTEYTAKRPSYRFWSGSKLRKKAGQP